jgi:hypothetical protein
MHQRSARNHAVARRCRHRRQASPRTLGSTEAKWARGSSTGSGEGPRSGTEQHQHAGRPGYAGGDQIGRRYLGFRGRERTRGTTKIKSNQRVR